MKRNGCWNRKDFPKTLTVQDGWRKIDGVRHMVRIPFVMARGCQVSKTTLGQADAGCLGCRHRSNVKEEK